MFAPTKMLLLLRIGMEKVSEKMRNFFWAIKFPHQGISLTKNNIFRFITHIKKGIKNYINSRSEQTYDHIRHFYERTQSADS